MNSLPFDPETAVYLFSLYDTFEAQDKGFMAYYRKDNEMIPAQESFAKGNTSSFYRPMYLCDFLVPYIDRMFVSYQPFNARTVYSFEFEDEFEELSDRPFEYQHSHMSCIDDEINDFLRQHNKEIFYLSDDQIRLFEKDLKEVTQ